MLFDWVRAIVTNPYGLALLCSAYVFHELYWKRRRLPPGPTPLLLAGNMLEVLLNPDVDQLFLRWKQRYGGIFTFWVGPFPMVMVADTALLKKYFVRHGDVFSGRWRNFITDYMLAGFNGVVQTDGEKWREQRRFSLRVLRDFGFGRPLMERKIMSEVERLTQSLEKAADAGVLEPAQLFGICVGNIMNEILFGRTFEKTDADFLEMQEVLERQSRIVVRPINGLYLTLPLSVHLPWLNRSWKELTEVRDTFWRFLDVQIREHEQLLASALRQPDSADSRRLLDSDFTFVYMQEMRRRRLEGDPGHFSDVQLKMLLLDLFFAGNETTVTTAKWGLLMLILHPEVQRKLHQELDAVPRRVELVHRGKLTYLQATINEIQRVANILPINLLRTVTEDVTLDGFHFPAGTMVLPQVSILLNDPDHFAEPERFRPERFLDENMNLKRLDAFLPFSIGKRQCLGESLARMELFLIFGNMLRNFSFEVAPDQHPPSTERVYGLTVSPPKFSCVVRRRP